MPYLEPFERDRSFIHAPKVLSQALELPGSVPLGPDPPTASANTQKLPFSFSLLIIFISKRKYFIRERERERERERKECDNERVPKERHRPPKA